MQKPSDWLINMLSMRYYQRDFETILLHIALATIADVDILVSWNFKHIVRYDKIRQFNAINLETWSRVITHLTYIHLVR